MNMKFHAVLWAICCLASVSLYAEENQNITQTKVENAEVKPRYRFEFQRKPLSFALIELARQVNTTLLFPSVNMSEMQSPAIAGEYTLEEVLKLMLEDTNLTASVLVNGQIKISEKQTANVATVSVPVFAEELVVTGIQSSIRLSADLKYEATQIIEVVTEEDIGKMPDKSVGEVLQRLPGVQIERTSGIGNNIRVRGLNQNLILFNGEALLTGTELLSYKGEYIEGSFENIPVELIHQIKVYKTPLASQVEGSIGGAIDLLTRKASEFDDMTWLTEVKVDYGEYSESALPTISTIFANQWTANLSTVVTLFGGSQTFTQDSLSYYEGFYIAGRVEEYEGSPYLTPDSIKIGTETRKVDRFGGIFNLAYRLSEKTELNIDVLVNSIQNTNESLLVSHDNQYGSIPSLSLDLSNELGFVESGSFSGNSVATSEAAAETNRIKSINTILNISSQIKDNLILDATFIHGKATAVQRTGALVAGYGNYSSIQWVGTEGIEGVETGWALTDSYNGPAEGIGFSLSRNNEPYVSFDDETLLTRLENGFFDEQLANGLDISQRQNIARIDFDHEVEFLGLNHIRWGLRHAEKSTNNDVLFYLTDFSQTSGLAHPNRYNEQGNLIEPSNFDPNLAPEPSDFNAAVQLPIPYDLCGNGGALTGSFCDVNGDGLDDNILLGYQAYKIGLWTAVNSPLYDLLGHYGLDEYAWGDLSFLPTRTFTEAPSRVQQRHSISNTWSYQNNIFVPNVGLMSSDIGQWIDDVTPNSPTEAVRSPTRSWDLSYKQSAFYFEIESTPEDLLIEYNLGLRIVYLSYEVTKGVIEAAVQEDDIIDEWFGPDFYRDTFVIDANDGTFPLFYHTETTQKEEWHYLPNANLLWKLSDGVQARLAYSETISPPRSNDIGIGRISDTRLSDEGFVVEVQGNDNLNSYHIKQYDIALEYNGENDFIYASVFQKDIVSNIIKDFVIEEFEFQTKQIETARNLATGTIDGFEFSYLRLWDVGFGAQLNYTVTDAKSGLASFSREDIGLPGISDEVYNLIGFFEGNNWGIRIAYSKYTDRLATFDSLNEFYNYSEGTSIFLTKINDAYSQWDARITWKPTESISLSADMLNITGEIKRSYLEYDNNTSHLDANEPRFTLSLKVDL